MRRRHQSEIPPQSEKSKSLRLLRAAFGRVELRQQRLSDERSREMTRFMPLSTDTAGPTDARRFYFRDVRDRRSEGLPVLPYGERRGVRPK